MASGLGVAIFSSCGHGIDCSFVSVGVVGSKGEYGFMKDGREPHGVTLEGRKGRVLWPQRVTLMQNGFRGPVDETTYYDYKRVNPLPFLAQTSPKRPRGEVPTLRCGQLRVRLPSLASREAARDALRPCPFFLGPRSPGNTPRIRVVRLSFVLKLKPVTLAGPAAYPPSGPSHYSSRSRSCEKLLSLCVSSLVM